MTAPYRVEITPLAEAHVRAAHSWWSTNRPAAPAAVREELNRASHLLAHQPHIGSHAANPKTSDVRRIYLARIRYHLYYRVRDSEGLVQVLALWHSSREAGPPGVGAA